MKVPTGHKHVPAQGSPWAGLTALIRERGSCGCDYYSLKYDCQECGKLLCGKNGPHCVRLTKDNQESPNGSKKLCVDCGIKIRIGEAPCKTP